MKPDTPTERRAERQVAASFLVCAAAAVALGVVYWRGGQVQLEGALLAVAFAGLCVGFVTWGNRLVPQGPYTDERHPMQSSAADRTGLDEDVERGGVLSRRKLLIRTLGLAATAMGAAALFPIRSLGPRPGNALKVTPWRRGKRLVTDDGRPVRAADVPTDGLVTVFPEGFAGSADGQAVLVRVEQDLIHAEPGRESWTPNGLVAYSKLCTHAGCPVGLYQADSHQLLCPCHQSTFDVLRSATPVFGPAAAALPQLPLRIDADGFVEATGDFSGPVGPAFWGRQ
jgi:ubiquinol-cytochrome c reductase iron-sulfur subunit